MFDRSCNCNTFLSPTMTIALPRQVTWLTRPDPTALYREYFVLGSWLTGGAILHWPTAFGFHNSVEVTLYSVVLPTPSSKITAILVQIGLGLNMGSNNSSKFISKTKTSFGALLSIPFYQALCAVSLFARTPLPFNLGKCLLTLRPKASMSQVFLLYPSVPSTSRPKPLFRKAP